MPGYGRSTKDIDQSDPFGDLAAAIHGLLDELDIDKAHLVGNSLGGAAALAPDGDRVNISTEPDRKKTRDIALHPRACSAVT